MIVLLTGDTVELTEPDVLTALVVRSALSPDRLAAAVVRQGIGLADADGEHVWLEPGVLHGPSDAGPDRRAALAAMIAFADRHGWVDPDGRVRAHVEAAAD